MQQNSPLILSCSVAFLCIFLAITGFCQTPAPSSAAQNAGATPTLVPGEKTDQGNFRSEFVRGKFVWLAEALQNRFGISSVADAAQRSLAIQTVDGAVLPIVEDVRGHAFRTDVRLREMNIELLVRRYEKHPLLQILKVYEVKEGKRFEVDYWCDICAIAMFEKGPCACCQDENRLRKRPVE